MARPRSFTGDEARALLRRCATGTLATLNREGGIPYASLANVATDVEGQPLILVSRLAWHTQNLLADPRASLLVAETPARGDVLTGQRATVLGVFEPESSPRARRRYLARHPEAAPYAGFADFGLWRLKPGTIHAVAGFGRIETLDPAEVFPAAPDVLAAEEEAIAALNRTLPPERGEVRAVDADGCDLIVGGQARRLALASPVFAAAALVEALERRLTSSSSD